MRVHINVHLLKMDEAGQIVASETRNDMSFDAVGTTRQECKQAARATFTEKFKGDYKILSTNVRADHGIMYVVSKRNKDIIKTILWPGGYSNKAIYRTGVDSHYTTCGMALDYTIITIPHVVWL